MPSKSSELWNDGEPQAQRAMPAVNMAAIIELLALQLRREAALINNAKTAVTRSNRIVQTQLIITAFITYLDSSRSEGDLTLLTKVWTSAQPPTEPKVVDLALQSAQEER